MKPLPYGLLPDKADAARGAEVTLPSAGDAAAWQREMERAQTQDWFQGATRYSGRLLAEPEAASRSTVVGVPGCQPSADGTLTASRHLAMQALRLDLAASADSDTRPAQQKEWPVPPEARGYVGQWVRPVGASTQDPAATAVRASTEGRMPLGAMPESVDHGVEGAVPMRLHLEIGEEGGRLWIGAAQTDPEQIAQAVAYVRQRLAARGIGLADVVCNGKSWNRNLTARAAQAPQVNYPIEGEHNGNG